MFSVLDFVASTSKEYFAVSSAGNAQPAYCFNKDLEVVTSGSWSQSAGSYPQVHAVASMNGDLWAYSAAHPNINQTCTVGKYTAASPHNHVEKRVYTQLKEFTGVTASTYDDGYHFAHSYNDGGYPSCGLSYLMKFNPDSNAIMWRRHADTNVY
jgi:hypothetical protein